MSDNTRKEEGGVERAKSWAIVMFLVVYVLAFGAIVFFSVGDRWPPDWYFGAVPDVPGQSPYSTERLK